MKEKASASGYEMEVGREELSAGYGTSFGGDFGGKRWKLCTVQVALGRSGDVKGTDEYAQGERYDPCRRFIKLC